MIVPRILLMAACVGACVGAHPVGAQPARINQGRAAAPDVERVYAYIQSRYYEGLTLDSAQRARMRRIIDASIAQQAAAMERVRPDQIDSTRVALAQERNAALRALLRSAAERERFTRNVRRLEPEYVPPR